MFLWSIWIVDCSQPVPSVRDSTLRLLQNDEGAGPVTKRAVDATIHRVRGWIWLVNIGENDIWSRPPPEPKGRGLEGEGGDQGRYPSSQYHFQRHSPVEPSLWDGEWLTPVEQRSNRGVIVISLPSTLRVTWTKEGCLFLTILDWFLESSERHGGSDDLFLVLKLFFAFFLSFVFSVSTRKILVSFVISFYFIFINLPFWFFFFI